MEPHQPCNPLHGVTLQALLTELVEKFGWETLGTRVRIVRKGKGGRIEVDFGNEDELHRIYEHLTEQR